MILPVLVILTDMVKVIKLACARTKSQSSGRAVAFSAISNIVRTNIDYDWPNNYAG